MHIVDSGPAPVSLGPTMQRMTALGLKLVRKESVGAPSDEGYIARGIRLTELSTRRAATRAVDMRLRSVRGEAWETEWPLPDYDRSRRRLP